MKVKKAFLTISILTLLMSCTSSINQLSGNWYYCDLGDQYLEFFTKKDSFRIVSKRGIETSWTHYRIESDTIYYIRPNGFKSDSTKAVLNYNTGKSLSMKFIDSNNIIELKPLTSIVKETDNKDELITDFIERSKNADCKN